MEDEDWWGEVSVHLYSSYLVCHAVLPEMISPGSGRIINLYGGLSSRGAPYASAYAAAKAGLARLVECLSEELLGTSVSVFCLDPGLVSTEMTKHLAESEAGRRCFSSLTEEDFSDPSIVVETVIQIASRKLDSLSGRVILAWDDGDALAAAAEDLRSQEMRVLRLTGI